MVILDNLSTHKNAAAAKAIVTPDVGLHSCPPYSPDLNPMDMAFFKIRAHLRRIGARTFTDLFDAIAQVCNLCSP